VNFLDRRPLLVAVVVVIVVAGALGATYFFRPTSRTNLPPGCTKPLGGFLIVADSNGYNDSMHHDVPHISWPVIEVKNETMVRITVCNADHQAHGFQVTHYFDSNIETVFPGQVVNVSFVADRSGTFRIYCSIFCTIHSPWMQSGELVVA
jgi:hypothetical protein